jgi:hypothetical protein
MRRTFIIALLLLVCATGTVEAKWPPRAGGPFTSAPRTGGFTGLPWLGAPIPPVPQRTGLSPVIGSVERTGHFVHPITGRTRYKGTAYDPTTGRFGTYRFRR